MPLPWLIALREAVALLDPAAPLIATLATVDRDGAPRARCIVIRHLGDGGALWFTSDGRSAKAGQLAGRNDAEIVLWIPPARAQFRFRGPVDSLGKAASGGMRLRLWRQLSDASRATFFWPDPGDPKTAPDEAFRPAADPDTPIPDAFTALFLEPAEVEQLTVNLHPHARTRWTAADGWLPQPLNP